MSYLFLAMQGSDNALFDNFELHCQIWQLFLPISAIAESRFFKPLENIDFIDWHS
jgi:hypothetical protein